MATPRVARSIFGPAKRIKISAPRVTSQSFVRAKSRDAENEGKEQKEEKDIDVSDFETKFAQMTLQEKLQDLEIEPEEFTKLWRSDKRAKRKAEAWEPKTEAEANAKWAELQKTPDHTTLLDLYRRSGVEPIKLAKERKITLPGGEKPELSAEIRKELDDLREPLNVRAINLRPLRRAPEHGVPVCTLQLRTYSIRNLLFFSDFAMRVAYYLGLPARGPVPLPRITERWTVPRANFIFKKSQENFERITMRRLIQIQDGHPDVVKIWLAFLQKHQYHGVGMKANIWEFESLEDVLKVGKETKEGDFSERREGPVLDKVREILARDEYKSAMQGFKSPVEQKM